MTSSRLPGKMNLPLAGEPVLGVLIDRLKRVPELDRIVLATTTGAADDVLAGIARSRGADVFRGAEDDVLGRVRGALDAVSADVCVEITGDCPLVDPIIVSTMIREFLTTCGINIYVANTTGPELGVPHGFDVQVFDAEALREIKSTTPDPAAREHVSLPFYTGSGVQTWRPRFVSFFPHDLCRSVWISLDHREDYNLIRSVHEELFPTDPGYSADAIIAACKQRPAMTRACLDLRSR